MENINSVRYKINLVDKLSLKSKQSQICVVPAGDVFNYLVDFMKEDIHCS